MLVDAEGAAGDGSDCVAGREVGEQFAAIVVHACAGADDNLVVVHGWLPRGAHARTDAPLTAGEGGVAYPGSAVGVIAGNDESGIRNGVGADVIAVELRIEVEDAAVFFCESAIPVVANAGSQ